jgi:signal transduction histidine kinase
MAQMVSNLLSNALTYGDPSEPVHVHASTGSDGLTIWIANKGTPISEKAMERLFTRFFGARFARASKG